MNYAALKKTDVANGPGVRVSLFVSGCNHACKGCFNREAWDFHYGKPYTPQVQEEILEALAPGYIRGLSVLGGEPLEPENRGTVLELLREVRRRCQGKDIWCYTGFRYEEDLLRWAQEEKEFPRNRAAPVGEILALTDVLVDGEFVEEKKNLRLPFRGSENQRIIYLGESRRQGRTVCLGLYVREPVCLLKASKLSRLITCSILQASCWAVSAGTPRRISQEERSLWRS